MSASIADKILSAVESHNKIYSLNSFRVVNKWSYIYLYQIKRDNLLTLTIYDLYT